jgi:hypothetical protein
MAGQEDMSKAKKKKEYYLKKNPIPQAEAKRVRHRFFSENIDFPLMVRENSVLWNGTRKPFGEEFLWLLLLGFWMAGIFIASSAEGSGEYYYNLKVLIERKGAHVVEFFILAYLFWKFLRYSVSDFKRILVFVFLFSLSYAVSDEFHQLFVFGREGRLSDVGIDCIGIFIFLFAIALFKKLLKKSP